MNDIAQEKQVQKMFSIIYQFPVGFIEADREGNILQMNAKSVQLLMPWFYNYKLTGDNIHQLLEIIVPSLSKLVKNFSPSLFFLTEPELQEELLQNGNLVTLNKGDVIVRDGQYVKFLPIVIRGAIRVYQQKEDREILLYYVRDEETCTMSLSAAYFNNKSSSHGVAVEPTTALVFPAHYIMEWQLKYPSWNKYVMRMFRSRYDELIGSFEKVAFEPINVRVMEYLTKKSEKEVTSMLNISHQHLANELGTTRVVISRILKQFEKEKKIMLFRGSIKLL